MRRCRLPRSRSKALASKGCGCGPGDDLEPAARYSYVCQRNGSVEQLRAHWVGAAAPSPASQRPFWPQQNASGLEPGLCIDRAQRAMPEGDGTR
jgi:hypothetical protein